MISDDLQLGLDELKDSYEAYETADAYARGQSPEIFTSPALRTALKRALRGYRHNFARLAITTVEKRLALAGFSVPNDDASTNLIEEIISTNELWQETRGIHNRVLTYGDYYVLAWPNQDGDPIVYPCGPDTTRIVYDIETQREAQFGIRSWTETQKAGSDHQIKINRASLYYENRIEKYFQPQQGQWQEFHVEGEEWPLVNEYDVMPLFHFRTARPYGEPEHLYAYGPQDAITKLILTHMSSVDYLGFPQRYALIDPESAVGTSDLSGFSEDDADEDDQAVAGLRQGPGELWALRAQSVGQFDAASAKDFLDSLNFYVRAMAQLTQTPVYNFDFSGEIPSGEARRIADAPQKAKASEHMRSLGATWQSVIAFCVLIKAGKEVDVVVDWLKDEVVGDKSWWETAHLRHERNIPNSIILSEAGYTEDQIEEMGKVSETGVDKAPEPIMGAVSEVKKVPKAPKPSDVK